MPLYIASFACGHVLECMCCVFVCVCVRIMACLFICRLTPVHPLLLISTPASLFRSPPSWLVMKTQLLERQVLCLKAPNALCCDFTGGHGKSYPKIHGWNRPLNASCGFAQPALDHIPKHFFGLLQASLSFSFPSYTFPCTS